MNPRIEKIRDEIEKIKVKMNRGQLRLRELEKQLTDLENADIVAAVRGVDIAPDELAAFVQMFKDKQQGAALPDLAIADDNKSGFPGGSQADGKTDSADAALHEGKNRQNKYNDEEDSI